MKWDYPVINEKPYKTSGSKTKVFGVGSPVQDVKKFVGSKLNCEVGKDSVNRLTRKIKVTVTFYDWEQ